MHRVPKSIAPGSSTELHMTWMNGDSFAIPYIEVRFYCPCAGCIDEHTGARIVEKSSIQPDIRPIQVQLVGRYAIQLSWSDRHNTGIYHYDRLWELCQKQGRKLGS